MPKKKYFIGVDEAGYGPNIGPLVVVASLWQAPENLSEAQLVSAFLPVFDAKAWFKGCSHVPLGDSKKLYQPSSGVDSLEAGVLAMWSTIKNTTEPRSSGGYQREGGVDFAENTLGNFVSQCIRPANFESLACQAWLAGFEFLPLQAGKTEPSEIKRLADMAAKRLNEVHVSLIQVQATVVHESAFNLAVRRSGSKGQLLSETTLELVTTLLEQCDASAEVFCDRQGGRKNYLPNLLAAMPDAWFEETAFGPLRSSYRSVSREKAGSGGYTASPSRLAVHFSVGGDSFPPTALSSMFAKYLRERLMQKLNAFWIQHVPGLKPTAGYPQDAKRFRSQIEDKALQLGLAEDAWWRCK